MFVSATLILIFYGLAWLVKLYMMFHLHKITAAPCTLDLKLKTLKQIHRKSEKEILSSKKVKQ